MVNEESIVTTTPPELAAKGTRSGEVTVSSPGVLDLDRLLAPVEGASPCGENLRWDPLYDEIRKARREDDRDALGSDSPVQADWAAVLDKATGALAARSKDLMLAGFVVEALVQLYGYRGLRDGLRVVNGLLEAYWDELHPLPDEDDLEPRAAPLVWLTEADRGARLPNRLREVAMAVGNVNGAVPSWAYWKSRYITPRNETEDDTAYEQRRAEAEGRAKAFEQAVAATPLAYYAALKDDLTDCLAELRRLDNLLDRRMGRNAPGTAAIRQSLDECTALVNRILKDKGGVPETTADSGPAAADTTTAAGGMAAGTGPINSRDEALRRLAEVAAFFRKTEPHSPISYLVQRATAWGRMSLEELVTEIVKDQTTREQIGELLGFVRRE